MFLEQRIGIIEDSEESCEKLHFQIYYNRKKVILNCKTFSQYLCFYYILYCIYAALVSIRYFIRNI